MSAALLPGDRIGNGVPDEWQPSKDGYPPVGAMLGTAVDSALLLLEARRWWLDEYTIDHPWLEPELEALTSAIAAMEQALVCQRKGLGR